MTDRDQHPTVRRMIARARRAHLARVLAAQRGIRLDPSGVADVALRVWASVFAWLAGALWPPVPALCGSLSADRTPGRTHLPDRPSQAVRDAHSVVTPARGPCVRATGPARRGVVLAECGNRVIVL